MPDWAELVRKRLAAEGERPARHADTVREVADHLADVHRAAIRSGRSEADADACVREELAAMGPLARAAARRARQQETSRTRGDNLAGLGNDLRYAVRTLALNPGVSALAILTLAVGIGACTAVFSVFHAILLRSLPYPDPDRLVLAWETDASDRSNTYIVAGPTYLDWRRELESLGAIGLWEYQTFNLAGGEEPEQVPGIRASSSLFQVLGVPPALGRTFTETEDAPGHALAVVSDAVWRRHLGADPSAVGRTLRLNGGVYEVIGVMPPGFEFPRAGNGVWVPIALTAQDQDRGSHSFYVAGRLADDVSFDQARAEIEQVGRSLQRYEASHEEGSTITPMSSFGVGTLRTMLTALLGAVAMLLLIACLNVANLQLGRALARRREMVLRLSLGASLGRIARQLFVENLLLAALGGVGGLLLAWMVTRLADVLLTPEFRALPFRGTIPITIDVAVIAFAAFAALASAVVVGFAPLAGLTRREPQELLRGGERGSTGAASLARRALVAAEIALAVVVLGGAGLLVKSLLGVLAVRPGFDASNVLTMQVSLPQEDLYGPPERADFCAALSESAGMVPGITSVGAISHLPLSGANASRALTIEGLTFADHRPSANYRLTCPGYFRVLGIPLLAGRDFTHRDVREGGPVVIVNRATVDRYWPGERLENVVGRRAKQGGPDSDAPWMTIVGVVENVRHFGLDANVSREMFRPYSQAAWPVMTLVAKTAGEPLIWRQPLAAAVRGIDPDLPVARVRSMEMVIDGSVGWRETPMRLLAAFAALGLLLAGIGVYGVLAYFVSQRSREIGVRTALGASRGQIVGLVLRESVAPIAAGLFVGVAGAVACGRLLQGVLYEVRPSDPAVLAAIALTLATVALVAGVVPARRAASIDPVTALRDE
ncbi:MAG TPA: ABC transporter permease [Vicinamibacterales bacterium]|nr:ABC transporter permease [Vicinamibacterales bacterium]